MARVVHNIRSYVLAKVWLEPGQSVRFQQRTSHLPVLVALLYSSVYIILFETGSHGRRIFLVLWERVFKNVEGSWKNIRTSSETGSIRTVSNWAAITEIMQHWKPENQPSLTITSTDPSFGRIYLVFGPNFVYIRRYWGLTSIKYFQFFQIFSQGQYQ